MNDTKKLGLWTLVMLIFVPTFGFGNIASNAVTLGPAAIPSWLIVSLLFFLPLSVMIAELASANKDKEGGLYTWIKCSIGPKWAFIGTWSYFVANLFYLQMVFSRIPVMISWTLFGENRFNDTNAYLLPWIGVGLAIALTYIATTGVKRFSKISDIGGKLTLTVTVIFIVFAVVGVLVGKQPSATSFTPSTVIPKFDANYFSTFSWLILAVAGAEVAGTYIKDVENPKKIFPRAVIIATAFVAGAYILGSLAICLVASPALITKAGVKDAGYVVYKILAENWGLNGKISVQIYAFILTISSIAAFVVWLESPIRAMFSEVPIGTFPKFLTKKRKDGTLVNALWVQCIILLVLIIVPLAGLNNIDNFFNLLTTLSALSLAIPYIVLAAAYLIYRLKGNVPPFVMLKSKVAVIVASTVVFILGVLAFFGAGYGNIAGSKNFSEAIIPILKNYGGPVGFIIFGFLITYLTKILSKNNIKDS
ncbi:amino acid permease [Clostridium psychrophilum]|uniref:amino acid permease n=1 Tax=Clostridium psychrophilum TaxID=132926 RepID=UPI001C0DA599|nr:amino acid permease [Clostridium psychrophilum]MBU3181058.1 amino acid permease [Clostridium psychrophilum]